MQTTPFNEFKSVEAVKAASACVQKLFPNLPLPIQGELQTVTRLTWKEGGKEDAVGRAGQWWLWLRNIFIPNTMTRDGKRKMMKFASRAATVNEPVTWVTTRSPELLHAQIGMGDPELPRSQKSLRRFQEIVAASAQHLPTRAKVLLADLAIDNLEKISQVCSIKDLIQTNLLALARISQEIGLDCAIARLSDLSTPQGRLRDLIDPTGKPKFTPVISDKARRTIERVIKESQNSHQSQFKWTREESEQHNLNLAITMGTVGKALQALPGHILIHNEAFISRGALNNIFNPPHDPLPVICLADLLEHKLFR